MTTHEGVISVADLNTNEGISRAAVTMAKVTLEAVVYPAMDQCPEEMRAVLFERYLSAMTGSMCASIGPDASLAVLDEVKLALQSVLASRRKSR